MLSEVRSPQPDAGVLAWLDQIDEDRTYLSVVSIVEIARGVAIMPEGARRFDLGAWVEHELTARLLTDSSKSMAQLRRLVPCGTSQGEWLRPWHYGLLDSCIRCGQL